MGVRIAINGYLMTLPLSDELWRSFRKRPAVIQALKMDRPFEVDTLEGLSRGKEGDYLCRGVLGEFYPCDAKVFEASYDEVAKSAELDYGTGERPPIGGTGGDA